MVIDWDTAENWATIAREERGTWGGRARRVAGEAADGLRQIGRIEDPGGILLGRHLIQDRRGAEGGEEFRKALMWRPATFAGGEIGCDRRSWHEGTDRFERGDGGGEFLLPGRGGRA